MKTPIRFFALLLSSFPWRAVALRCQAAALCVGWCIGGSLLLTPSAFPQGSLTPPGAPAPTMKTLDQIDTHIDTAAAAKRIPIDAAHPPGDASNEFIISAAGSYYLTGNLKISKSNGIHHRRRGDC